MTNVYSLLKWGLSSLWSAYGFKNEGKRSWHDVVGLCQAPMLCLEPSSAPPPPPRPQEFPCLCPIPTSSMFLNLLGNHTVSSQDVWFCFRTSKASSEFNQQKFPWEAFAQDAGWQLLLLLSSRSGWKVWWTKLFSLYSDYKGKDVIENFSTCQASWPVSPKCHEA